MKTASVALALLLFGTAVHAQESIYSLQFFGVSEETGDMRARAMGTLGIALDDPHTAITLNPGSMAALERMTISVLGGAGTRTSRDATIEASYTESTFPHTRFALPIYGEVVVSLGFLGLRNYRSSFVLPKQSLASVDYAHTFSRKGSLYTVPLGVARGLGKYVHAGATIDFMLGTVDEGWVTGGDSLLLLRTRRRDEFGGTTVTLGAVGTPAPWLHIGGTWTPGVRLERKTTTTIEDSRLNAGVLPVRIESTNAKTKFPATYRAGLGLDLGRQWTLAGDLLWRDWKEYDGRLYGAEGVGAESRFGGGVEFHPRRPVWWGRLAYRAGLSRSTWPQELGGDPLRQIAGHFGTGLDLNEGWGRLDLGVEYARIGTLDLNGYEESRWMFLVSISGQEVWRRRSPRKP